MQAGSLQTVLLAWGSGRLLNRFWKSPGLLLMQSQNQVQAGLQQAARVAQPFACSLIQS